MASPPDGWRSLSWSEKRRWRAASLFRIETVLLEERCSGLVYDEGRDLLRFPDGRFAFSEERAGWELLVERGAITPDWGPSPAWLAQAYYWR
jgi:hypothetical protein